MAARHQQQGRGLKQVVVRFNVEQDAALLEWLTPFAASYDMTKVIRLACYALAGLEPEQGLLALLPAIKKRQNGSGPRMQRSPAQEVTYDALAEVMQELAALRAAVIEQQALDDAPSRVLSSSGLDLSSPRRKTGSARAVSPEPFSPAFDRQEAQQRLLASIKSYGQVSREAYRG